MSKGGVWLIALTSLLVCPAGRAATQGPDGGGYTATDGSVYSFVNIAGGGGGASVLAGTDDGTAVISLPFPFTFYGTAYTQICVSTNGAAYFVTDPSVCPTVNDFANVDLTSASPSSDLPAIMPMWSDLTFDVPGAGAVFYQTIGAAGSRRFILQWNNAFPQGSPNPVTFQAILTEGTNGIAFEYQTASLGPGNPAGGGAQATVAIRSAGGIGNGRQLQWSFDSAALSDSSALLFTPGAGPLPVTLTAPANGATGLSVPSTLSWTASAGATSYDIYLGTTSPPALVGNTASTSFIAASLLSGTTYNWQIVAKNGAGSSASATWTFTTLTPPPSGGGGGGGGAPPSPLTVSPTTLSFGAPANSGPISQTLTLTYVASVNYANVPFQAAASDGGAGWLHVSPGYGSIPFLSFDGSIYTYQTSITVTVIPSVVDTGTYTGQIQLISGVTAAVTFTKSDKSAVFMVNPASLSFTYRQGDVKSPVARNFTVTSEPSGAVFTPQVVMPTGGNWLSVPAGSVTTPGSVPVTVNPANLPPGAYSGKVRLVSNGSAAFDELVTLTVISKDAPIVTMGGIVPVYSSSATIAPGSWISIYGSNLAGTTAVWNGDFPTSLGGVSVTVNGKPAYLWFVSPTQINLQAPDDTATGTVNVVVTNENGSVTSTTTLAPTSPSFSVLGDGKHLAAVILTPDGSGSYGGGQYDLSGPAGAFAFNTRPVKPGEQLELFGVGFGPTNPMVPAGQNPDQPAPVVNPVSITIGGVPAEVSFAGITSAGLYQFNLTVPNVASGDQTVTATVAGVVTQTGLVIAVQ